MKLLILNHFFDLDIAAIEEAKRSGSVFVVPFLYFRSRAGRILNQKIIRGELEEFNKPEYAECRKLWRLKSEAIFARLHSVFQFDCFVVPSDSFFYIRDFIMICKDRGIPVLVLQKETTIAPHTMEVHSKKIGREFPFISDLMLVCSIRQKQFWLNAGTEESKIIINGQPRFDMYADKALQKNWHQIGLNIQSDQKVILFFSYDLDAYAPKESSVTESGTWQQLRNETEIALKELADKGFVVLIKPHPQQRNRGERRRLAQLMAPLWGERVIWVDRIADARQFITNADVVVGFQTTGLYEAMLAGKPVVYTHWTKAVKEHESSLIPFWEYTDSLDVAGSPSDLIEVIQERGGAVLEEAMAHRRRIAVEHVGEIDGHASTRALNTVKSLIASAKPRPIHQKEKASKFLIYWGYARLNSCAYRGLEFTAPLFFILFAWMARVFPTLSKGSKSSSTGLRNRFHEFRRFWNDFANQSKVRFFDNLK